MPRAQHIPNAQGTYRRNRASWFITLVLTSAFSAYALFNMTFAANNPGCPIIVTSKKQTQSQQSTPATTSTTQQIRSIRYYILKDGKLTFVKEVPYQPGMSLHSPSPNTLRQPQTIYVDYTDPDLYQNRQTFVGYLLNENLGCYDTLIHGQTIFLRTSFYEVRFQRYYDANNNQEIIFPPNACVNVWIDTIYVAFSHVRAASPASPPDTMLFMLFQGGASAPFQVDTLILDTSLTGDQSLAQQQFNVATLMLIPESGDTFSPPTYLRVRVRMLGRATPSDSVSFLFPLIAADDPCNAQCFDYPISYPNSWFRLTYPIPQLCNGVYGPCNLFADCNSSGSVDTAGCECVAPNFGIAAVFSYEILAELDADLTSDNVYYVCVGDTINLVATPGYSNYLWSGSGLISMDSNTATVLYSSIAQPSDTFEITLQASTGQCNLTDKVTIYVWRDPPIANFTYNVDINTNTVTVNNTSAFEQECLWFWGDGNISTQCDPLPHVYSVPGNYEITLIVRNPCGADTITQPINLTGLAEAKNLLKDIRYFVRDGQLYLDNIPANIQYVQVINRTGQVIRFVAIDGKPSATIPMKESAQEDLYFLQFITEEGQAAGRLPIHWTQY